MNVDPPKVLPLLPVVTFRFVVLTLDMWRVPGGDDRGAIRVEGSTKRTDNNKRYARSNR